MKNRAATTNGLANNVTAGNTNRLWVFHDFSTVKGIGGKIKSCEFVGVPHMSRTLVQLGSRVTPKFYFA